MWFNSFNYIVEGYKQSMEYSPDLNLIKRGILIDTTPLFILIVGHYDKTHNTEFIKNFQSKIRGEEKDYDFRPYDYEYLLAFLNSTGLAKFKLFVTPHIFTEFIKHLWVAIDNPITFQAILEDSLKSKKYIQDVSIESLKLLEEEDFLNKKLEIGDISVYFSTKQKIGGCVAILTDDKVFANIMDKKYGLLVIFYNEIRTATLTLGSKNIPTDFLKEPICS